MTIEYWTTADALNGLCEMEDVGDVRETARVMPPAPEAADTDAPMPDDIFEVELAAYRADPARYRAANASNLNKLLDVVARRQERAAEKPPQYDLASLDERILNRFSSAELKRILIHAVLEFVPNERREEALRMISGAGGNGMRPSGCNCIRPVVPGGPVCAQWALAGTGGCRCPRMRWVVLEMVSISEPRRRMPRVCWGCVMYPVPTMGTNACNT